MERCENIYHCIAITGGLNCPLCELDRLRAELEKRDENYRWISGQHAEATQIIVDLRAELAELRAQVPLFWYRPHRNGMGYDGPISDEIIEQSRKDSGVWEPLYAAPVPQPAVVCDDCGSPCTQANNAKSHIKRCAACQSAFIASLDAAITAQHAVPIGNSGCNYLSLPGFVCRKCGAIHGQSPDVPASTAEDGR